MNEKWKTINGYNDYIISRDGDIRRIDKFEDGELIQGKNIKQKYTVKGFRVNLMNEDISKSFFVEDLLNEHFYIESEEYEYYDEYEYEDEPFEVQEEQEYLWQINPDDRCDEDKIVGVIPDIHIPFTKWEYIEWLIEEFQAKGVNTIVCIGDIVDNHVLSRHDTHPEAIGGVTEYNLTVEFIAKLIKVFPYMSICWGNHCKIPERQAATLGISTHYLKSFHELYDLPDTWIIEDYHIINDVRYLHGLEIGGEYGHKNSAKHYGMSAVTGHRHSILGGEYINRGDDDIFGAACGCLIDLKSYAFAYGKLNKNKPILGTLVISASDDFDILKYKK